MLQKRVRTAWCGSNSRHNLARRWRTITRHICSSPPFSITTIVRAQSLFEISTKAIVSAPVHHLFFRTCFSGFFFGIFVYSVSRETDVFFFITFFWDIPGETEKLLVSTKIFLRFFLLFSVLVTAISRAKSSHVRNAIDRTFFFFSLTSIQFN